MTGEPDKLEEDAALTLKTEAKRLLVKNESSGRLTFFVDKVPVVGLEFVSPKNLGPVMLRKSGMLQAKDRAEFAVDILLAPERPYVRDPNHGLPLTRP